MEVAAFLSDKAASVTVVGNRDIPFSAVLGPEIGSYIKGLHMAKNVKFVMGTTPEQFITNSEGSLSKVVLENGEELDTDVIVLGIGVDPSTDYIRNNDVQMDSRGFVIVDECMKTYVDNIFAAGDIVRGASLVVWAIRDGRDAAVSIQKYLEQKQTDKTKAAQNEII